MPWVYVRCFSSPLPEWCRARHVLDHCRAIHAVLTADVTPILPEAAIWRELLPIYDVSARHEVTNLAIAEPILQRLGKDPGEWIEHVADRLDHDRRYLIEPAKLERKLGWLPTVDFAARLAETVDWYVRTKPCAAPFGVVRSEAVPPGAGEPASLGRRSRHLRPIADQGHPGCRPGFTARDLTGELCLYGTRW